MKQMELLSRSEEENIIDTSFCILSGKCGVKEETKRSVLRKDTQLASREIFFFGRMMREIPDRLKASTLSIWPEVEAKP